MQDITVQGEPLLKLPPPEIVRQSLAKKLREADLLRKLLKLSESAAKEQAIKVGGAHVA